MTKMGKEHELVEQLIRLLNGGSAHAGLGNAVENLPASLRGVVPAGLPYSIWQLLEHIRIAQWDMLEFSRDPLHRSPKWPEAYWPAERAPADDTAWDACLHQIKADLQSFTDLLHREDLFQKFPHGEGQTLLLEALQLADHNAYHVGEIILIRRLLGAWK